MREYGENPHPNIERMKIGLANAIFTKRSAEKEENYWKRRNDQGLEKVVKQKRRRTVPDIRYQKFYDEANELSSNIGRDSDKKTELLIKYFPGRFGDKGRNPVNSMDYLKVGNLFNKLVDYSQKRIQQ